LHSTKVIAKFMASLCILRGVPFQSFPFEIFEHQTLMLELRTVTTNDSDDFHAFILRNLENFRVPFPLTTEAVVQGSGETKLWIQRKKLDQDEGRSLMILLRNRYTQEIIFVFSAFGFDWRVPKCEVAWMMDQKYEGLGLATVVVGKMINYLFNKHGVNKIICRIEPGNRRSEKLAERLRFKPEGTHAKDFRNGNDQLVDVTYYGLCRP
jgi:ribosomal-protein-serine acetyltransferase